MMNKTSKFIIEKRGSDCFWCEIMSVRENETGERHEAKERSRQQTRHSCSHSYSGATLTHNAQPTAASPSHINQLN